MPEIFKKLFAINTPVPQKTTAPATDSTAEASATVNAAPLATDSYSVTINNQRFNDSKLKAVISGKTLKSGEKGQHVAKVQQALLDLGFALPSGADGAFGSQTKGAIKGFQTSQGLSPTGELDSKTMRALDEVAPAPGKKAWEDPNLSKKAYPAAQKVGDQYARVIVDKSEHRMFMYTTQGDLEHIYPVATGANGTETDTGTKIVTGKVSDPSSIGKKLWGNSKAFGTKLLDLSWYDPSTGKTKASGEELHGTYVDTSIGTNASHGCIRMYNKDIEAVYKTLRQGDRVVVKE